MLPVWVLCLPPCWCLRTEHTRRGLSRELGPGQKLEDLRFLLGSSLQRIEQLARVIHARKQYIFNSRNCVYFNTAQCSLNEYLFWGYTGCGWNRWKGLAREGMATRGTTAALPGEGVHTVALRLGLLRWRGVTRVQQSQLNVRERGQDPRRNEGCRCEQDLKPWDSVDWPSSECPMETEF